MDKIQFTNKVLNNLNNCINEDGKVMITKFIELTDELYEDIRIAETKQLVKHDVSSTLDLKKMDKKFDELLKEWDAEKLQKWIDSKG